MTDAVDLKRWPEFFREFMLADKAGSRARQLLSIDGRVNYGRDAWLRIGRSRDALGAVLHLSPATTGKIGKAPIESCLEVWLQWWTKIATRAGYRAPAIDPIAERTLLALPENARVEFIFDTNALVDGTGHYLARRWGSQADLVHTVVSDLEVQNWAENVRAVENMDELTRRACFLSACRFLERIPHDHPIWRPLDITEETALFTAKPTRSGEKSAGNDALLLRATRLSILDQVPRLHRFFVTADKGPGRIAAIGLPYGSTIVSYANAMPSDGQFLSPLLWWPASNQGHAVSTDLATFLWESLCICDQVRVTREHDGRSIVISAFLPGRNQFPSLWHSPCLWVDCQPPSMPAARPASSESENLPGDRVPTHGQDGPVTRESTSANPRSPARSAISISASRKPPLAEWPLKKYDLLPIADDTEPSLPPPKLLSGLYLACQAAMKGKEFDPASLQLNHNYLSSLRSIIRMLGIRGPDGSPGPAAADLWQVFVRDDLDMLSARLTVIKPYHRMVEKLRKAKVLAGADVNRVLGRATYFRSVIRALGQAVEQSGSFYDGSGFVGADEFRSWLLTTVDAISREQPLGEAPIALIAQRALAEHQLSPARFGRALSVALTAPDLQRTLQSSAGGTPTDVLSENIARLSTRGVEFQRVSADGLLGYRTLKRKSS